MAPVAANTASGERRHRSTRPREAIRRPSRIHAHDRGNAISAADLAHRLAQQEHARHVDRRRRSPHAQRGVQSLRHEREPSIDRQHPQRGPAALGPANERRGERHRSAARTRATTSPGDASVRRRPAEFRRRASSTLRRGEDAIERAVRLRPRPREHIGVRADRSASTAAVRIANKYGTTHHSASGIAHARDQPEESQRAHEAGPAGTGEHRRDERQGRDTTRAASRAAAG